MQIFRQLVPAGAKVGARCGADKLQFICLVQCAQIHVVALEKSFYTVDHAVHCTDLICLFDPFRCNSVEASIDDCCGTSGLSHNDIFFHVLSSKYLIPGKDPAAAEAFCFYT